MTRPLDYPAPFSPAEAIAPPTDPADERIEVGVLIVGGGPAGLACAIRMATEFVACGLRVGEHRGH